MAPLREYAYANDLLHFAWDLDLWTTLGAKQNVRQGDAFPSDRCIGRDHEKERLTRFDQRMKTCDCHFVLQNGREARTLSINNADQESKCPCA